MIARLHGKSALGFRWCESPTHARGRWKRVSLRESYAQLLRMRLLDGSGTPRQPGYVITCQGFGLKAKHGPVGMNALVGVQSAVFRGF